MGKFTDAVREKFDSFEQQEQDSNARACVDRMEQYWIPYLDQQNREIDAIAKILTAAADELL